MSFGPEKKGEKPNDASGFTLCREKNDREEVDQSNTETTAEVHQGGRTTDPQVMGKPAEGNR